MDKSTFLDEIKEKWYVPLKNDKRFINQGSLLKKFESDQTPQLINELILANLILSDKGFVCQKLLYEPLPKNAKSQVKTIDFYFETENRHVYCDVKTIKPQVTNAWEKFEQHQQYFPKNVGVHLDRDGLGGELYHNMHNSRASMLTYAIELEQKISKYGKPSNTHFILAFFGNGFHWHLDELEDFADFYVTGRHNPGDQFSEMEIHNMKDKKISFNRTIDRFAYIERQESNVELQKFRCPVHGPWLENRWVKNKK